MPGLATNLMLIFVFGGLGALSRFAITHFTRWPSIGVNVIGSFLIGLMLAYSEQRFGSSQSRFYLVATAGFLGAFTTFSAFSLELLKHVHEGSYIKGFLYVNATLILTFLATLLGYLSRRLL